MYACVWNKKQQEVAQLNHLQRNIFHSLGFITYIQRLLGKMANERKKSETPNDFGTVS